MTVGPGIAAIAWDIDGTLVDSEGLHHRALMAVSAQNDVPVAAEDDRFVGMAMDDVWERMRPLYPSSVECAAWLAAIDRAFVLESECLEAVPGVLPLIEELNGRGLRQCCVSNSSRAVVDATLAAIGVAPLVEFSISRDDVCHGKPHPEPYRIACQRLGLPPSAVVAVEDSDVGAAAARAAGCTVVRVSTSQADLRPLRRLLSACEFVP